MGLFSEKNAPLTLGLGSSLLSGASGIIGNMIQRKTNKELAEYSYQKDVEMWNMANEYNSPSAQMARLKEAGLNPNLAFGSGNVAGNTTTQTPKYQMPDVKYQPVQMPNVLGMLGQYQDIQRNKAVTDNLDLQGQGIQFDNQLKLKDLALKDVQLKWLEQSFPHRLRSAEFGADKLWYDSSGANWSQAMKSLMFDRESSLGIEPWVGNKLQEYENTKKQGKAITAKYSLDWQRFNQLKRTNELDYLLKSYAERLGRSGLSGSDDVFLKMIQMTPDKSLGGVWDNDLMKYYLLQQGGSFVGDALQRVIPQIGLGFLKMGKGNTPNTRYTDTFGKDGKLKSSTISRNAYEK